MSITSLMEKYGRRSQGIAQSHTLQQTSQGEKPRKVASYVLERNSRELGRTQDLYRVSGGVADSWRPPECLVIGRIVMAFMTFRGVEGGASHWIFSEADPTHWSSSGWEGRTVHWNSSVRDLDVFRPYQSCLGVEPGC